MIHFLVECERISRRPRRASGNDFSLPDDVPVRPDGRCTVHLLGFHNVFQLPSHFPGLTKQFGVQEMFHAPIVSKSAQPNRNKEFVSYPDPADCSVPRLTHDFSIVDKRATR